MSSPSKSMEQRLRDCSKPQHAREFFLSCATGIPDNASAEPEFIGSHGRESVGSDYPHGLASVAARDVLWKEILCDQPVETIANESERQNREDRLLSLEGDDSPPTWVKRCGVSPDFSPGSCV